MPTPNPVWHYIVADLRRRIDDGEWAQGETLPSMRQLADEYETASHAPVSRAVLHLINEGCLTSDPAAPRRGVQVSTATHGERPLMTTANHPATEHLRVALDALDRSQATISEFMETMAYLSRDVHDAQTRIRLTSLMTQARIAALEAVRHADGHQDRLDAVHAPVPASAAEQRYWDLTVCRNGISRFGYSPDDLPGDPVHLGGEVKTGMVQDISSQRMAKNLLVKRAHGLWECACRTTDPSVECGGVSTWQRSTPLATQTRTKGNPPSAPPRNVIRERVEPLSRVRTSRATERSNAKARVYDDTAPHRHVRTGPAVQRVSHLTSEREGGHQLLDTTPLPALGAPRRAQGVPRVATFRHAHQSSKAVAVNVVQRDPKWAPALSIRDSLGGGEVRSSTTDVPPPPRGSSASNPLPRARRRFSL
ncbi:winged helix-turn-helix domain-containing protein [Streptomyces sp. NPDC056056]|uniref:winged helix-turn-helix domain-containing protein n=1 Tax=Streptomyces sp. NPDC056056 TaxID=3345698 RepID=UPI0035DD3719